MGKKITDRVTWVGKTDWELNEFHGHEYSTEKGSSYNSYLIRDRKTVLMDTVWKPFDEEFVANLEQEIDLKDIDCIVMNHNENDHSGALPALMRKISGYTDLLHEEGRGDSARPLSSGLEFCHGEDRQYAGDRRHKARLY